MLRVALISGITSSAVSVLITIAVMAMARTAATEAQTSATMLTAEQFVVQDSQGQIRALLGVEGRATILRLFDQAGRRRVQLTGTETGAAVALFNPNALGPDRSVVALTATDAGGRGLFFTTESEQLTLSAGAREDATFGFTMTFVDTTGEALTAPSGVRLQPAESRGTVEFSAEPAPAIQMRDRDGGLIWSIP